MLHRIREAMKMEPVAGLLGGAVQVDRTWIGGNPKNRHANDPREAARKPRSDSQKASDKQPMSALVHYETHTVYGKVVPDVTGDTLMPAIAEVMDPKRPGCIRAAQPATSASHRNSLRTSTSITTLASTSAATCQPTL